MSNVSLFYKNIFRKYIWRIYLIINNSARTGEQVRESFDYLARMCVNSLEVDDSTNNIHLDPVEKP